MKTRRMLPALVATALVLAAAAVLVGRLRSVPPPAAETSIAAVPDPASGRDAEPVPRPDPVRPSGTPEVGARAPAPAALPATGESPELYATGAGNVAAEASMEAPTSAGPDLDYDQAPAASPDDSPTGSQPEEGAPQLPVTEPFDRAPTEEPSVAPAVPVTDTAVGSRQSTPTEAPPH